MPFFLYIKYFARHKPPVSVHIYIRMKKRIVRICAIGLILAIVTVSVFLPIPRSRKKNRQKRKASTIFSASGI